MACPRHAAAQFFNFVRAIPEKDPAGIPLPGANTTFANGSTFQPAQDAARSHRWTWRPFGDEGILSSLGPNSSTPPTNTLELATTVTGLQPGGEYAVQALFWSPDSSPWGVRAGLSYGNGLRTNLWHDNSGSTVRPANLFPWETSPSIFRESGRTLFAASLGNGFANSNGQLTVFVHDLPATDADFRTWYQGVAVSQVTELRPHIIDAAAAGTPFNRGVRGLALADITINRGEYHVGIPRSLEVARGSAIRGVATGLAAEVYDWRTRNGQARPPTLQFLRQSRDFDAELFIGVNMRGIVEPNPAGGFRYYDTNALTLAQMAADWVRYVNHIVPTYRQGDSITNSRDAAILGSLTWQSDYPGDTFDRLLAPAESPVPRVTYWEIGNEPTIGVTAYSVSNSFTVKPDDYGVRYRAITEAMKAENPTVKVGPTIISGDREEEQLNGILSDPSVPIDFITYHPYERMGDLDDPATITLHLGSVYSRQKFFYDELKRIVAENGRNPDDLEYAATEVNVSYWDTNDGVKEAQMAHALGTVETVFSHARLGLVASHYWIWPTHRWDGTEYPIFKAYEKLRDHMGDTLISIYAFQDLRLYTTRDSRTGKLAVWVLNFANRDAAVDLSLQNMPNIERATLLRLADKSGTTTLESANYSSEMPGGRAMNVDWTSSDLTSQISENVELAIPAATLSVLVIEPGLGEISGSVVEQGGEKWFEVAFTPVPFASNVRYKLLGSCDLSSWEPVAEVGAGTNYVFSISTAQSEGAPCHQFFRIGLVQE